MSSAQSEFMPRFTGSEVLKTIPARAGMRNEIDSLTNKFLRSGGKIEVLPTPEYNLIRPPCKYLEVDESKPTLSRGDAAKWLKISDASLLNLHNAKCGPKRHVGTNRPYAIADLREWRAANLAKPFYHPVAAALAGMLNITSTVDLIGLDPRNEIHRQFVIGAANRGELIVAMQFTGASGKVARFFWREDIEAYKRTRRGA